MSIYKDKILREQNEIIEEDEDEDEEEEDDDDDDDEDEERRQRGGSRKRIGTLMRSDSADRPTVIGSPPKRKKYYCDYYC